MNKQIEVIAKTLISDYCRKKLLGATSWCKNLWL